MGAPKIKSNISDIKSYTSSKERYPMFVARVKAGFPSPGDDYIEKNLDLNELLIRNPSATFFVKVEGDSMVNAGINSGDTLVVDKALEAKDKSVVIAHINGELTVKRIWLAKGKVFLNPENEEFSPIEVTEETDFDIWGVVTYVIHKV